MVGSMVAKVRADREVGVPNYVAGMDSGRDGIDVFSFGAAYLGSSTHPFTVHGDPSSPDFKVRNLTMDAETQSAMGGRASLLRRLDTLRPDLEQNGRLTAIDGFRQQAMRLVESPVARETLDLNRESLSLREKYGLHPWGMRALMARRLVEAGASFVTMVLENPMHKGVAIPTDQTYNWDSHAVNCHIFKDTKYRLPLLDRTISALIDDLYDRGLDRRTLLIVTGEFGRTPRISYSNNRPGRDHWPSAMSVLVSGGGLRMGQVVGSTNSKGEHPKDRPLTPNDLWATMFEHLGIDHRRTEFLDHAGRPLPILPYGDAIKDLT